MITKDNYEEIQAIKKDILEEKLFDALQMAKGEKWGIKGSELVTVYPHPVFNKNLWAVSAVYKEEPFDPMTGLPPELLECYKSLQMDIQYAGNKSSTVSKDKKPRKKYVKVNELMIRDMQELYKTGMTMVDIARTVGVSPYTVSKYVKGNNEKEVDAG